MFHLVEHTKPLLLLQGFVSLIRFILTKQEKRYSGPKASQSSEQEQNGLVDYTLLLPGVSMPNVFRFHSGLQLFDKNQTRASDVTFFIGLLLLRIGSFVGK
jgi:hypothetical protein